MIIPVELETAFLILDSKWIVHVGHVNVDVKGDPVEGALIRRGRRGRWSARERPAALLRRARGAAILHVAAVLCA